MMTKRPKNDRQKQATISDRHSPRPRTPARKPTSPPPDPAVAAQIRSAVRAALAAERRHRQVLRAKAAYRKRHRRKLRDKDRTRRARQSGQTWTLPDEVNAHDPIRCAKGHAEDCRYYVEPAAEPDPEPQGRKPHVKPLRQAVRIDPDWRGPDGFGPLHPAKPYEAFDTRGRRRVRINGEDYIQGGGGLLADLDDL